MVRICETIVVSEVDVPVLLDLPECHAPTVTVSCPAKKRFLPAEVSDRPRVVVFVIAASGSIIDATPIVAATEDLAVSARL